MPLLGLANSPMLFFELVAILIRKWLTGGQLVDSRVFPVLQNGRRHPFFVDERSTNIRAVTMRLDTRPSERQRVDDYVSHLSSLEAAPVAGGLDP